MDDPEADTVPFEPIKEVGPQALPVNREDTVPAPELPAEAQGRVPEPAVIRGVLVAVAGLVAAVTGKKLGLDWIDPSVYLYVTLVPIGLSFWARRHVTPVKK